MLSTTSAPLGTNPSNADLVPVPAGLLEKKKADKNAKKKHKKKSKKAKAGGKSSASTAKSTASSTTKKKPVHEEEESSDDMPKKVWEKKLELVAGVPQAKANAYIYIWQQKLRYLCSYKANVFVSVKNILAWLSMAIVNN